MQLATRPGRVVGLEFVAESAILRRSDDTTPDAMAAVTSWLAAIGCATTVRTMKHVPALVGVG